MLFVCQPGVNLQILYLNSSNAKRTLKAEFNLYLSRERLADNQFWISEPMNGLVKDDVTEKIIKNVFAQKIIFTLT